jgi:hypothetical protein
VGRTDVRVFVARVLTHGSDLKRVRKAASSRVVEKDTRLRFNTNTQDVGAPNHVFQKPTRRWRSGGRHTALVLAYVHPRLPMRHHCRDTSNSPRGTTRYIQLPTRVHVGRVFIFFSAASKRHNVGQTLYAIRERGLVQQGVLLGHVPPVTTV